MDGEEIAIEDAGVAHALTADFQQIVGPRRKQPRIDLVATFHVLGGEDGAAGGHPPDEWQAERLHQPDAPRPAFFERNDALGGEGAQMGFGGIGRTKTESCADFGPGGRTAFMLNGIADELQDFLLAGSELVRPSGA